MTVAVAVAIKDCKSLYNRIIQKLDTSRWRNPCDVSIIFLFQEFFKVKKLKTSRGVTLAFEMARNKRSKILISCHQSDE